MPDLATEIPTAGRGLSADGKTYTITLRPGVEVEHQSPPVR